MHVVSAGATMKSGVPVGYKQTEVGVIPEDWEVKSLGDVTAYTNGKAHEGCISELGKYIVVNSKFISTNGEVKKYSDDRFSPTSEGDILMVMSDVPNGRAIAKCFYVDQEDLYTVNQRICSLRSHHVNGRLLYYKLNRHPYYLGFDDGVKQTNLRKNDVLSCPLALPPTKAEQEAIAEVLSDTDALIESQEQLITKKHHLKQCAMQELLTGKKRLPGFSGEWEVKRLDVVCSMKSGEGITSDDIDDGYDYPCFGSNGLRGYAKSNTHDGNYSLIGRQGALCGNVLGVKGKFFASEHAIVVTPFSQTDIVWLTFILGKMNLNQYSESSAQPGLSVSKLLDLSVYCPPTKAEQTAIATILFDMDAEITTLETKLAKTRQLKQGMMHKLLSGQIRLI